MKPSTAFPLHYVAPNRAEKPEWWRVMRHEAPELLMPSGRHTFRKACVHGCTHDVVAVDFLPNAYIALAIAKAANFGRLGEVPGRMVTLK